jgi:FtsZ-binding cell division protein ZapB
MANAKTISFVDAQIKAAITEVVQPLQLTIDRLREDVGDLKRERDTPVASARRETEKAPS